MRHNVINSTLILLIAMSTAGCSVARLAQSTGQTVKTEIRQRERIRDDIQLGFEVTGDSLNVLLYSVPYYKQEQREIHQYRSRTTGLDWAMGLASLGVLYWVVSPEISESLFSEPGSIEDLWNSRETWQKAVMVGIPADWMLSWIVQSSNSWTESKTWEKVEVPAGEKKWRTDYPYYIRMPDYDFGKTYYTTSGDDTIDITEFLSDFNTEAFLDNDLNSLTLQASTTIKGQSYEKEYTLNHEVSLKPFLDFAYSRTDRTSPTINLDSFDLDEKNVVEAQTQEVTISGSVKDESEIQENSIQINGIATTLSAEGKFTLDVRLKEGNNKITLTAKDKRGNPATEAFTIRFKAPDTTPPMISLDSFNLDEKNVVEAQTQKVTISGAVKDDSGIQENSIQINGIATTLSAEGKFTLDVRLKEGNNKITLTAKDKRGNSAKAARTIYRTPVPPKIDIQEPTLTAENYIETSEATLPIQVAVTDESGIRDVKLNGDKMALTDQDKGIFTISVNGLSSSGANKSVTITATDNRGTTATKAFTIRFKAPDTTPPMISLDFFDLDEKNVVEAQTQKVTISGAVKDDSGIQENSIQINGIATTLSAEGKFTLDVRLKEGNNKITLTAKDKMGNPATEAFTIRFKAPDTTPPMISLDSFDLDGKNVVEAQTQKVTISGAVEDDSGIQENSIQINGIATTLSAEGKFTLDVSLNEGKNEITLTAKDKMGNPATEAFTIRFKAPDTTPPMISLDSFDLDGKNVVEAQTQKVTISGAVEDDSGIQENSIQINGIATTLSAEGKFTLDVSLNEGKNEITLTAKDKMGNPLQKVLIINRTPVPPKIDIQEPTLTAGNNIETSEATLPVQVAVTDESGIRDVKLNGDNLAGNATPEREDPTLTFVTSQLRNTRSETSNKEVFALEFFVADDSRIKKVTVKGSVDGKPYDVSKQGKREYMADLELKVGKNSFEIKATDQWNNHQLETITITRLLPDTDGPMLISLSIDGEGKDTQDIRVRGAYAEASKSIVVTDVVMDATPFIRGILTDDSGIASVHIQVNDNSPEPVDVQEGKFQKELSLDYGKNLITIQARDTNEHTRETKVTIYQRPDRNERDFALFFATNKYKNHEDLKTPIPDAEKVSKKLKDNYGFKIRIVKNSTSRDLMETILDYKKEFIDEDDVRFGYKDDSQLLLYFSGHGYYNEETEKGYLITSESEPPDIDRTLSTALEHGRLRDQIDLIKCPRVLVLMDTCFSGTLDPMYITMRGSGADEGSLLEEIKTKLKLPARWLLTAASNEYVADIADGERNSPFTLAFLNALDTNGGDDSLLNLNEIWEEIQKSVDSPVYKKFIDKGLELPKPHKAPFGSKKHLYKDSDFLLFPTMTEK